MENQKCPNCSASMIAVTNRDGTNSYHCEYCGNVIKIQPKTASDKIFAFVNRVANAIDNNKSKPFVNPDRQAEYEARLAAINQKKQEAYEKYQEKRLKNYEKYVNKKFGK